MITEENKPAKQPLLRFTDYKVISATFTFDPNDMEENEDEMEVAINTTPNFLEEKKFHIESILKVNNKKGTVNIEVTAIANFNTTEIITEEYKTSHFVKLNAPAIFFPYLRAFITTLSVNSGYNPIILPTFNFSKKEKE